MCSDIAISVRNLSKTYRIFGHPGDRLKQALTFGLVPFHREFTALQDVSFDIKKGETVGIIGRNGSGKSTLLQLLCGILKPSSGSVTVNGRISALLELGAGFNPEFTGRENIFFQGAVMGFTQEEMRNRFDDIARFADIGAFIEQPVRMYSSGMYIRLAFAVAIHVEPEILVVDEALAVGDALFQKRCYSRIREMQERGLTLILVSHDHELVRNLTTRALLLGEGAVLYWGDTREATHRYRKILFEKEALRLASENSDAAQPRTLMSEKSGEYGIGGAEIIGFRILDEDGELSATFRPRERVDFEVTVLMGVALDHLNISVVIKTVQGMKVYSWGTLNQDISIWAAQGQGEPFWDREFSAGDEIVVVLSLECNLGAGTYEVQAVVSRELDKQYGAQQILHWRDEMAFFRVEMSHQEYFFGGICDLRGKVKFNG